MSRSLPARVFLTFFRGLRDAISVQRVVLLFYYSRTARLRSLQVRPDVPEPCV